MESLEEYIGTYIMVTGKDSITVLTNVRGRKIYHSSNLVFDPNNKPIPGIIIYYIEFTDVRVA